MVLLYKGGSMYIFLFFLLGLILGSFYVNLGIRIGENENICFPSSHCDNCSHKLKFYDLFPVLSYIFLKGKCRYCMKTISPFYPLLELLTGILFSISFIVFAFSLKLILALILSSLLIIVIVTDFKYYLIPDSILLITLILIFVYNYLDKGFISSLKYLSYGLIMFVFIYSIMLIGNYLLKKESLGGGDVKLLGVLGTSFLPLLSFFALTIASFFALIPAVYVSIKTKEKIIPFGPFIILAFLLILFSGLNIKDIVEIFTFVK